MAEKKGFFRDPAPEMAMGFKGGNVEVLESSFKVVHPDTPAGGTDPGAHPALVWKVKRLDDELQPILNSETDEPVIEELGFSVGNKFLSKIHPGKADSPDDKDIEDAGYADGAEGNTLFFVNGPVQIHAKSAARVLYASLEDGLKDESTGKLFFTGAGVAEKYLDKIWAPYWKGCIFHMTGFANPLFLEMESRKDASKKFAVTYKIVDKIIRGPGEKGKKGDAAESGKGGDKAAAGEKGGKSGASGDAEVVAIVKQVMNKLSEDQSGKELSFKLFWKAAGDTLKGLNPKAELLVPATQMLKDEQWLADNAKAFDMTVDADKRVVAIG